MKLIPLGVCGAYPRKNCGTSSYYLSSQSSHILLDFGSGALSRIQNYIDVEQIDCITLTHYHADHVCDMLLLMYYLNLNSCKKIKVLLPNSPSPLRDLICSCNKFDLEFIKEGKLYSIGSFTLNFYEVQHIKSTYAVKVSDGGVALGYTSDTVLCKNLQEVFKNTNAVICDCAKEAEGSMHMSLSQAAELAKKHQTQCLVSHIVGDIYCNAVNLKNAKLLLEGEEYEFI